MNIQIPLLCDKVLCKHLYKIYVHVSEAYFRPSQITMLNEIFDRILNAPVCMEKTELR